MMTLLEINFPRYKLRHHNGHEFTVEASRLNDGCLVFEPLQGWNDLSVECQQDTESLLEEIDDVIYNATPEAYDPDAIP
jgi:hypothetical protein